ncbi:hypothetical protein CPC08DRAFT_768898 [Agrocybe pediades]|nr:hypothetical protein CPC08DRAFT_768898 [Agrocybe pediades]
MFELHRNNLPGLGTFHYQSTPLGRGKAQTHGVVRIVGEVIIIAIDNKVRRKMPKDHEQQKKTTTTTDDMNRRLRTLQIKVAPNTSLPLAQQEDGWIDDDGEEAVLLTLRANGDGWTALIVLISILDRNAYADDDISCVFLRKESLSSSSSASTKSVEIYNHRSTKITTMKIPMTTSAAAPARETACPNQQREKEKCQQQDQHLPAKKEEKATAIQRNEKKCVVLSFPSFDLLLLPPITQKIVSSTLRYLLSFEAIFICLHVDPPLRGNFRQFKHVAISRLRRILHVENCGVDRGTILGVVGVVKFEAIELMAWEIVSGAAETIGGIFFRTLCKTNP